MVRKTAKRIGILLLTLLLALPLPGVSGEASAPGVEKISGQLLEEMASSTGTLPVAVWLKEPDLTGLQQQADEMVGPLEEYNESALADWLLARRRAFNALCFDFFEDYVRAFVTEAGLAGREGLQVRTHAPMAWVELTNDEIYRLAQSEQVTALLYMDNTPDQPEELIYPYTAGDSLRILQVATGKAPGEMTVAYDVNQDGLITATDALLALQHATGKIVISWPDDYVFLE